MGRATNAVPNKERGIESTLSRLGIDTSLPASEAAQDAADEASQETEGEDDEVEGGDAETPLTPKDEMRLQQQQDGVALSDDLDEDDEGGDVPLPPADRPPRLDHAVVPNPASSRGGRGRPREKPKAPGGMSKSILDKVPGAEKVMVHKRIDGKKWFVAEFQREDLESFATMEAFLTRYVKPKNGAGEYDITGFDSRGNTINLGQTRLLDDASAQSTDRSAINLVEKVMAEQRERDERFMQQQMNGRQDPLQLLAGVMNLKKQIDSETNAGAIGMTEVLREAMSSGKDSNSQMMMMMMTMMQSSQQMVTALLTKPKEDDPIMKALLAKLLSDGGGLGGGGGMAMPPPMIPPPALDINGLLTAVAGLVSTLSGGGGEDEFKEYLKAKELSRKDDQLGIKDVLQLVMEAKNSGGGQSGGFKDTIDNLAAVMNIAQNISRQNEPGPSAGFFDAIAALFSNRDFAASISQAIRLKADAKAGAVDTRIQAEVQRLQMERRLFEREKQAFLIAGGKMPALQDNVQPPQQMAPQPQNMAQPQVATGFRPAVTSEQVEAAKQAVQSAGMPALPAQTGERLNNIMAAKDDADRVGKTIALLVYFSGFDEWKKFSEGLLICVRNGHRAKAMEFLQALFEGLAHINLFPKENIRPLLELLNENFMTVQEQLLDFTGETEQQAPMTGEELSQPLDAQGEAPAAES